VLNVSIHLSPRVLFAGLNRLTLLVLTFLILIGAGAVSSEEEDSPPAPVPPVAAKRKIVVIDPGHGGPDTGIKGDDRTIEKELTLSLARLIETRLAKKYKIVMTRKGDTAVDLRKRSETANRARGDVFLSLHAGAAFSRDVRGVRLLHHTFQVSDTDPGPGSEPGVIVGSATTIRWNEVQRQYLSLSRTLAMILGEHIGAKALGDKPQISVMGLPDLVLAGTDMPALQVEIGQLTSPADEKRLKDKEYLAMLADGICSGIEAYFSQYPEKRVHTY